MLRAIWFLLGLALVLSVPVFSQDGEAGTKELEKRIEMLEDLVSKHASAVGALQTYAKSLRGEAAALTAALKKAEKAGYLYPAPNTDAKKALMGGLKDLAKTMAGPKKTAGK